MAPGADELRLKVAISSRILGWLGLMKESTGHVSARILGTEEMWVRCRGGDECGLTFTGLHNVRRTDFDGRGPGLGTEHAAPNETAIHGEIYRARPQAGAVVHAHPPYALRCGITNIDFRPVFGAYDPSALDIVLKGVPVFPRAVLVSSKEVAAEMLAAMGDRDVVLMKGHGITVHAPTIEAATTLAIRFDNLARLMWDLATSGRQADELPPDDLARFRRTGEGPRAERGGWAALPGVEAWGWKYYVKLLQSSGIGLPDDTWA